MITFSAMTRIRTNEQRGDSDVMRTQENARHADWSGRSAGKSNPVLHSRLIAAAALLLAFECACSSRKANPPSTVTVAIRNSVMTDQPNLKNEAYTESVLGNIYEPLVSLDPDLRLIPWLAESWENPSTTVWRFHIRQGVRFHDGAQMSAEDVRASIEETRANAASDFSKKLHHITAVTAADPMTIDLTTDAPSTLLDSLTLVKVVHRSPDGSLAGTGPYRLVESVAGSSLTLHAFDDYWRGKPPFPEVKILLSGDPEARFELLMTGAVQIAHELPLARLGEVRNSPDHRLLVRRGVTVTYIAFDTAREKSPGMSGPNVFRDRRVREAVALGVDRAAIVEETLRGFATEAWQIFPPDVFGYTPHLHAPSHDVARAKQLMAEAGLAAGFNVRIDVGVGRLGIARAVSEQLAEIGIHAEVNPLEGGKLFEMLYESGSTMYLVGWGSDTGDGQDMLEFCFHVPATDNGPWHGNAGHYTNPELTTVLKALTGQTDQRERLQMLGMAAEIIGRDYAWIPLVTEHETVGVSRAVDVTQRADARLDLFAVRPAGHEPE